MIIIAFLALLLIGATAALVVRVATIPRMRVADRLRSIDEYGFAEDARPIEVVSSPQNPRLQSLAGQIGAFAMTRLRANPEELRKELRAAGMYGLTPGALVGYRVLGAALLPTVILYAGGISATNVLLAVGAGAAGWVGPLTVVRRRARMRQEAIDRDLPELVDLLVVTVEAGLSFSSSLQVATERLQGPLGQELRLALQEQNMGLSTEEALDNLLQRCDTPSMRSFVRTVVQGESLGVSIGTMMRNLSRDMRVRRRKNAEERAQKAPVKLLFPLVFLIFPSMFLVMLGPAVIETLKTFQG